jgi:crossover junction endodeoxyribonuclease RusA
MSKTIKITLPFPPSLNNMFPTNKQGKRFLSKRGKDFKDDAQKTCLLSRVPLLTGELSVNLRLFRPAKRGDIDNFCKPVFDAVKGFCFVDDRQIVELHILRFDDRENPRVEMEINEI